MSNTERNIADHGRRDRIIQKQVHDPYMAHGKPAEPTVCPECRAVFSDYG